MGLFKKDKKELSFFQKIKLINKISKAIKQAKKIMDNNKDLGKEIEKGIKTLKADLETLAMLVPSLKEVVKELKNVIQ